MSKLKNITIIISFSLCILLLAGSVSAQGYGGPLTFHGIEQYSLHSAGSRGMAGISVGMQGDAGLMFQNPATLASLQKMQLSLGGKSFTSDSKQVQQYAPVRYYSNLSLLLEGLTDQIPDPPPDTSIFAYGTVMDTVQRPFDDIKPNWFSSKKNTLPLQAILAVPVTFGNYKISAGIGAVEYADMYHYYQNNNALSPGILSQRPLPTLRPTDDDPTIVDWYQTVRSRNGQINGYGFSLAAGMEKYNLSVGFSGMILDGGTDDFEQEVGRGKLTFFSNAFRADSVSHIITKSGKSKFRGQEYMLSSMFTGKYVSIALTIKMPATITRKYSTNIKTEIDNTVRINSVQGEDKLKLPWRGTLGIALTPKDNLSIAFEYESRPYNSARYIDVNGEETSPWLSSSLVRMGLEYLITPWLALRGGMRGQAEVFEEEGNQLEGEPVSYTIYSAGFGLFYSGFRLNITYENSTLKYQDVWSTAISKNNEQRHVILGQISYDIPTFW
jgi:hypothetical protein